MLETQSYSWRHNQLSTHSSTAPCWSPVCVGVCVCTPQMDASAVALFVFQIRGVVSLLLCFGVSATAVLVTVASWLGCEPTLTQAGGAEPGRPHTADGAALTPKGLAFSSFALQLCFSFFSFLVVTFIALLILFHFLWFSARHRHTQQPF